MHMVACRLESEQWTAIGISAEEEDLQELIDSPDVDLWFIKAPLQVSNLLTSTRWFIAHSLISKSP